MLTLGNTEFGNFHSKMSHGFQVDGDRSHVLGSGQDTQSSVGAHAALLSAASAGAGYAVFA